MQFKDVIGQSEVKTRLLRMVSERRIGHAMLFSGREGTGMLGLAIAFARYLNCKDPSENDSCTECSSCRKYSKLEHPDLHFVFPVAKKKDGEKDPVSDDHIFLWRETVLSNPYISLFRWFESLGVENKQGFISKSESQNILRKLSLKSYEADYKVMIIWMAEKMNATAANKLLKILEEPPSKTMFILISEDASQIIPTILSRTQQIKIPRIDNESLAKALREIHGVSDEMRSESLINHVEGNYLRLTEALDESEETMYLFTMFVKFMRFCYMPDFVGVSGWIDEIDSRGRERHKHFFQYALRVIRGNFILSNEAGDIDMLTKEEKEFSEKFSKFVHKGNIFALSDEFSKASLHIEYNGYSRLVFFDLAIKTARLLKS
jgi:DNA polymerase III subunit delta'